MRKNFATMLLAGAALTVILAGCGNKTEGEITPTPTTPVETLAPTETVVPTAEPTVAPTEEPAGEPTAVPTETPVVTENVGETKVTLGQYKGLTLYEVDSSVIALELVELMEGYAELKKVNRAAEVGDTVNINYVGKKDGVAFDGGTDDSEEGYNLELGSGSFIDGFEDGLIGAVAGEVRDLELTFPENYGNADLAGQAVVFTVTVNAVQELVTPELTDDFAKENLEFDTVAQYISALYEVRNEEAFYNQITEALMATSTVENYPAGLIESEKQSLVDYYTSYAEMYGSYYGMDTETTLAYMFGFETKEALESYAEEYAFNVVKNMLILTEVAMQEGLTISEEEYQRRALIYAISYGYEDVETFEADYGGETVFEAVTMDYIMDYIISLSEIVKAENDAEVDQEQ